MRRIVSCFLIILLIIPFVFSTVVYAEEAKELKLEVTAQGIDSHKKLFDDNRNTYITTDEETVITVSADDIAHLYIEFDRVPSKWVLRDTVTKKTIVCGGNAFLHEYIDVAKLFGNPLDTLQLSFPKDIAIADIYALSAGELPDWVQVWDAPCEQADLMLITTHSDDEQLFFAGVLPYYAIERKLAVQVVYSVQHFEVNGTKDHKRPHEQLDGLWTVGIRNYPVISSFPDVYSESKDRKTAFSNAQKAFGNVDVTYDDFCGYITENLRRFKPLVVVSHDLDGEYGHGAHVFTASALTESIVFANDKTKYPESFEKYGAWETEKTYLHLYDQNKIVMDWDTAYESMGGKTPFQMTQAGFKCHKSQHYTWFNRWLNGNGSITKASQIKSYSPCEYGLYATKVGADKLGGDFMENVVTYAERKAAADAADAALKAELAEKEKAEQEAIERKNEEKTLIALMVVLILIACVLAVVIVTTAKKIFSKR